MVGKGLIDSDHTEGLRRICPQEKTNVAGVQRSGLVQVSGSCIMKLGDAPPLSSTSMASGGHDGLS